MQNNSIEYQSAIRKNLLDLLMFSLYADARTIYREYVQNALDSINYAVKNNILAQAKDGVVNINIDDTHKIITIRDNGTGIDKNNAVQCLLDISGSKKDGITAAGQFGIGRLAGGGYCHKLVFKTSAKGEDVATIVTFDVDRIWQMVKEDPEDYLATFVVDTCTKKEQVPEEEAKHYFEVQLRDVKRDSAPILLKEDQVIAYLNEVAPVSYKPEFNNGLVYHSAEAAPEFKPLINEVEKVQVYVGSRPILKQYGLRINGTKDEIDRLEYFKIESPDYGLLGWGWFGLTLYTGQIINDNLACIRLRKHNIQIGNFDLLSGKPLWREERGNSYFYGELFVTHENIVPNAARDGLAPTPEKEALYAEITDYFKNLTAIYTKANQAKNAIGKIREGVKRINDSRNANDHVANDYIDNKGKAVYSKLVKNATFPPMQRMLDLYKDDYETACLEAQDAKANAITPASTTNPPSSPSHTSTSQSQPSQIEDTPVIVSEPETQFVTNNNAHSKPAQTASSSASTITGTTGQISSSIQQNTPPYRASQTPSTSVPKGINKNLLKALEGVVSADELWTLRRVFRILNMYCPDTEHDQHLIETLEREIIREFENDDF